MASHLLQSFLQSTTRTLTPERRQQQRAKALEGVECAECFLRRDRHGGFGVFFERDVEGVVRWVEPLHDGASDGRASLRAGDTITRVGGLPTPTTAAVVEALRAADSALSVTVAKTSRRRSSSSDDPTKVTDAKTAEDFPFDAVRADDPLPTTTRVPFGLVKFCVATTTAPTPSSRRFGRGSSAQQDEDAETIVKAAITAATTEREEPRWPKLTVPAIAAAVSRELGRFDEAGKSVADKFEKSSQADPTFSKAATLLAKAVVAFSASLKVASRPEFRAVADGFALNVSGLAAPTLALVARGVLPLMTALAKSAAPTHLRSALRSLTECERREAHAGRLADLTRSLKDDAVRSLSETDLELAVRAAFSDLADAVAARDHAQRDLHVLLKLQRLIGGRASTEEQTSTEEEDASSSEKRVVFRDDATDDKFKDDGEALAAIFREPLHATPSESSVASRPGKLLSAARRAKQVLLEGSSRRAALSARALEELDEAAQKDADEAAAKYAVARCAWAATDAERHAQLSEDLAQREHALAEKARNMAARIATHANALALLSESARDRLVTALEPPPVEEENDDCHRTTTAADTPATFQEEQLGRYFDLAEESIEARADLVRRQILCDREQVISGLDKALKELKQRRHTAEKLAEADRVFRTKVERRLRSRAALAANLGLACKRADMLSRAAFAALRDDLETVCDHVLEVATQIARLDVDLRLAHVRLVALALRAEIDRAQRAAPASDAAPGAAAKRVAVLFDAVNGTKCELHRVRDDALSFDHDVEAALADLAEVEVLGARVAAASDAENADARADKLLSAQNRRKRRSSGGGATENSNDDEGLGDADSSCSSDGGGELQQDDDDGDRAAREHLEAFASPYDDSSLDVDDGDE